MTGFHRIVTDGHAPTAHRATYIFSTRYGDAAVTRISVLFRSAVTPVRCGWYGCGVGMTLSELGEGRHVGHRRDGAQFNALAMLTKTAGMTDDNRRTTAHATPIDAHCKVVRHRTRLSVLRQCVIGDTVQRYNERCKAICNCCRYSCQTVAAMHCTAP